MERASTDRLSVSAEDVRGGSRAARACRVRPRRYGARRLRCVAPLTELSESMGA